jgi:hypothetical protein
LRYYLGAVGIFGWLLLAVVALWIGSVLFALRTPGFGGKMTLLGVALMLVGNIWIAFIAFRDHHTYGMLCFFTCLFTYVYIFMNLEETWRPAALTTMGFLFMASAALVA